MGLANKNLSCVPIISFVPACLFKVLSSLRLSLILSLALGLGLSQASAQTPPGGWVNTSPITSFTPTNSSIDISQLTLEKSEERILLGANLQLELGPQVTEALLKGVSLVFTAEVEVLRDRWYWMDKRVALLSRSYRLTYHPLSRVFKLTWLNEGGESLNALSQSHANLADALTSLRRIRAWRILDARELDESAGHSLDFRFFLDTSALPRPLQIGIEGQTDWTLRANRTMRWKGPLKEANR